MGCGQVSILVRLMPIALVELLAPLPGHGAGVVAAHGLFRASRSSGVGTGLFASGHGPRGSVGAPSFAGNPSKIRNHVRMYDGGQFVTQAVWASSRPVLIFIPAGSPLSWKGWCADRRGLRKGKARRHLLFYR